MSFLILLLVLFQIKHFLCDYILQTPYMLRKGESGWSWVGPLMAHAGVHSLFTCFIILLVNPALCWLAFVDFGVHFLVDRFKAGKKYLGRYQPNDKKFWWALGFDQMCHHLTHYYFIYKLVMFL